MNDEALTFEALGLLAYLLSRPDNWQVRIDQISRRGGAGRQKSQRLIRLLIVAGYIVRKQNRDKQSKQFGTYEYIVYDDPAGQIDSEPETENQPAAHSLENDETNTEADATPQTEKPRAAFQPAIIKTESNKPLSEESSASNEASASPPSITKVIWSEGLELLNLDPSRPNRSIVGKWLKRTPTADAKEKLLAMIRAARRAGTGDPVAYVSAALNREYPPPPDPAAFTPETWVRNVQAAIKCHQWSEAWRPAPGKRGCRLPTHLITPAITQALQTRRIAL